MGGPGSGNRAWGAGYHAGKSEGFSDGSIIGALVGLGAGLAAWAATWGIGKLRSRRAAARERLLAEPELMGDQLEADAEAEHG